VCACACVCVYVCVVYNFGCGIVPSALLKGEVWEKIKFDML